MDLNQRQRLRPVAREKAEWYAQSLSEAADAGANVHQVGIDRTDDVAVFVETLDEQDRGAFWELWTEELSALTAQKEAETAQVLQKAEEAAAEESNYNQLVTAIIGVAVFLIILVVATR